MSDRNVAQGYTDQGYSPQAQYSQVQAAQGAPLGYGGVPQPGAVAPQGQVGTQQSYPAAGVQQEQAPPQPHHFDIFEEEEKDGVRLTWNVFPRSKLDQQRIVIPIAAHYTPLKTSVIDGKSSVPVLRDRPVKCKCGSILNPFAYVEQQGKFWTCPFCFSRNIFPMPAGQGQMAAGHPHVAAQTFSTVEYILFEYPQQPLCFIFVLDTCMIESEFDALRNMIQFAFTLLPPKSIVGLVTAGTNVQIHEVGSKGLFPKTYVLNGNNDFFPDRIIELLDLTRTKEGKLNGMERFLQPLSVCQEAIEDILDQLTVDPFPVSTENRPVSSIGAAMGVAVSLLEVALPKVGSRIMNFIGTPCTNGEGAIATLPLKESVRSHHDISKSRNIRLFKKAKAFYGRLAERAFKNGHCIDIVSCSLDQTGILEMKPCVEQTGGVCMLAASFDSGVFKDSLVELLSCDEGGENMKMGLNTTIQVLTTQELKISGALGPVSSLKMKTSQVSDNQIGVGGTFAWNTCGIDALTTIAFIFEVANAASKPVQSSKHAHIQFVTSYLHGSGFTHLRVTTMRRQFAHEAPDLADVAQSFDQEAAAALMARLVVYKSLSESSQDVLRWLDRSLIRLVSKFSNFNSDDFISPEFVFFPQFMFYLRRSCFLQTFNFSPDETAYHHVIVNRTNVTNTLLMIQPSLTSYSFRGPPEPVQLDARSILPDTILVLDSFFQVIIFHGEAIAQWRDQRLQDKPEHNNFKMLLEATKADAKSVCNGRFPAPVYIECDQHDSQSRYVTALLNPSITHKSHDAFNPNEEVIFTHDVSLDVFIAHLKKLASQPQ